MNWVDGVFLVVVVVSALVGLSRGFVREALGLAAWVIAAVVAVRLYDRVQPVVLGWVGDPDLSGPLAFAGVFLVVLIVASIAAHAVAGAVRGSVLGSLDRSLGAVFGVVRGVVLLMAAYIGAGMVMPIGSWPPPVLAAQSLPLVHQGAVWVVARIPEGWPRPQVAPLPGGASPSSDALLHAAPQGAALAAPH